MSNAFVLRIKPSGIERVSEALKTNDIIIGWSSSRNLLDPNLGWEQFRQIVCNEHYPKEEGYSRSGNAAGNFGGSFER